MPLVIKENISRNTKLGVWRKDEDLHLLESVYPLNATELNSYQKIGNEWRKSEWLITRVLLTEVLEKSVTIKHNINGKPVLENHQANISISHSKNFVAIIVSSIYFAGVDIECVSPRVAKVKHKFLTDTELRWCNSLQQQTICWSAKEAVFKVHEKNLAFKDMETAPFAIDDTHGTIKLQVTQKGKEGNYPIKYRLIGDDVLTYLLSKSPLAELY